MNMLAWFGTSEYIIIGVIAVLVFGRRLPEVGRNLGRSLVEFKQSLKGAKAEVDDVNEAVGEVKDAVDEAAADITSLDDNKDEHTA